MNGDLIKRIVRAIASGSQKDLDHLAKKVVDSERESGHAKLAEELDGILKRARKPEHGAGHSSDTDRTMRELPVSRRNQELLATLLPKDSLEHHMVLPPDTEARFCRVEREYAARERLGVYGLK